MSSELNGSGGKGGIGQLTKKIEKPGLSGEEVEMEMHIYAWEFIVELEDWSSLWSLVGSRASRSKERV